MEDLKFRCQFCGQDIESPAHLAGRGTHCPSCGRWFVIPCEISPDERVTIIHRLAGDVMVVVSATQKGQ